jgi:GAF domain-containing protein
MLADAASNLVDAVEGGGCVVSRMLGDVLIAVAEHSAAGGTLQTGHGYLVSEFPETEAALHGRRPRALSLGDEDVDAGEAAILRELGFDALLLLPLEVGTEVWGLVEVYRGTGTPFSADELNRAESLVQELGRSLAAILTPAGP